MSRGILLPGTGLKARVSMIAKGVDEALVKLTHVKGTHRIQLSDLDDDIVFNLETMSATYPEYEKVIGAGSFVDLDGDGQARGFEWKPIGIGSGYLKQCGDIARLLDTGRPKSEREKTGMVVRAFTGDDTRPVVFDFPGWPGAVLFVMPHKTVAGFSRETAQLLAPAVKGSVAALRAHSTRWLQVAKAATSDEERAHAVAKAKEFQDRVASLLQTAPIQAIGKQKQEQKPEQVAEQKPDWQAAEEAAADAQDEAKAKAEAEPTPEPEDEAQDDEPAPGPKVKRRKIKVGQKVAAE